MLGGKPLFKGRDCEYIFSSGLRRVTTSGRTNHMVCADVDQLTQILNILGTPDDATLRRVGSERVRDIYFFISLNFIDFSYC